MKLLHIVTQVLLLVVVSISASPIKLEKRVDFVLRGGSQAERDQLMNEDLDTVITIAGAIAQSLRDQPNGALFLRFFGSTYYRTDIIAVYDRISRIRDITYTMPMGMGTNNLVFEFTDDTARSATATFYDPDEDDYGEATIVLRPRYRDNNWARAFPRLINPTSDHFLHQISHTRVATLFHEVSVLQYNLAYSFT